MSKETLGALAKILAALLGVILLSFLRKYF
jgi:hypothetical protein